MATNGKATILVVEDEAQVRTLLAKLLEKNDFEVATATDGLEAMKFLETTRPDLMLVDVMLEIAICFCIVSMLPFIWLTSHPMELGFRMPRTWPFLFCQNRKSLLLFC